MSTEIKKKKTILKIVALGFAFVILAGFIGAFNVHAQVNKYVVKTITLPDGRVIEGTIYPSPPYPPLGIDRTSVDLSTLNQEKTRGAASVNILSEVPAFNWCFGCSATSAAMIAGYYDRHGFPNMYAGLTNGGVMPLDNSAWPDWEDSHGDTRHQCPLSATRNGLDGRSTNGHVDYYWYYYGQPGPDPWVDSGWTEHTYGDCTGDFMKTNQWIDSAPKNTDGGTIFYNYTNGAPFPYDAMETAGYDDEDGGYGLKLFYQSRTYSIDTMYNQYRLGYDPDGDGTAYEPNTIGFTYDQYKAEIDAGRPVMIHVKGHTMVGVGYDDATNLVYLHDTWDYGLHTMTWGGFYGDIEHDMEHMGVTIVQLEGSVKYTLTVTSDGHGTVTGSGTVNHGEAEEITATPDPGYDFVNWTVTTGTASLVDANSSTTDVTLTSGDATVQANFQLKSYTLTVTSDGHGTVTGSGTVNHGEAEEITATPDPGYDFVNWTVTTGTASLVDANSSTTDVTLTAGDATVQANFQLKSYTLTVTSDGHGTVTGSGTVNHGEAEEITATPDPGYDFVNWTVTTGTASLVDANSSTTDVTLTAGDATVQANFQLKSYTLTVTSDGHGTVTGLGTVNHGEAEEITATPDPGYDFVNWTVTTGTASLVDANSSTTDVTLTSGDATVQANFQLKSYTLTVTSDGHGTVTGSGTVNHGEAEEITATPDPGYDFVNWTVTTGTASLVDANSSTTDVTLTAGDATVQANFQLKSYTLTVTSDGHGTVTGSGTVNHGEAEEITATADPGYDFVNWTVTTGTASLVDANSSTTDVTLTAGDATVQANFELKSYTLTVTSDGHGTVTGSGTVNHGEAEEITATPDPGYDFVNWTVTNGTASLVDANSSTTDVTLTAGDATVQANFELKSYTLTVTSDGHGTVTGSGTVNHGEAEEITATPDPGYDFVNWTVTNGTASLVDANSSTTDVTLTAGDATVQANFELKSYTLTVTSDGHGTVTGSGTVNHGEAEEITATPDPGYDFVNWTVTNGTASLVDANSSTTDVTLTAGDATVQANFELKSYTLTVTSDGHGTVTGSGTVNHGEAEEITATPDPGYDFVNWTVTNGTASLVDANSSTTDVTLTAGDAAVQANFELKSYTLTVTSDGHGTVTGSGTVNHGEAEEITATADPGYDFVNWTVTTGTASLVDANSSTTDVTLTAGDATVQANFQLKSYTVNVSSGSNGSVNPSGNQIVDHGNTFNVTATPSTGYHFSNWTLSGGVAIVDGDETGEFTITGDGTIQANFVLNDYTVNISSSGNGTVGPSGDQPAAHNEVLLVEATPIVGYHFVDWTVTGGVAITDGDETGEFTITGNGTITANFTINEYAITVNTGPNGTITPAGPVKVDYGHNSPEFTIAPNISYKTTDVKIDGNSIGVVSTHTFENVTENHTISATFDIASDISGNNEDITKVLRESFSVFPNPVSSNEKLDLFFKGKQKLEPELVIYDQIGNVVYHESYPPIGGDVNKAKKFGDWNLRNKNGRAVASGTYLAVLTVSGDYGKKERYITKIGVKEY